MPARSSLLRVLAVAALAAALLMPGGTYDLGNAAVSEPSIRLRDGDWPGKLLPRLKRLLVLIGLSNDLIGPNP